MFSIVYTFGRFLALKSPGGMNIGLCGRKHLLGLVLDMPHL